MYLAKLSCDSQCRYVPLPSFLQVLTSLGEYKRTAVAGVCKN